MPFLEAGSSYADFQELQLLHLAVPQVWIKSIHASIWFTRNRISDTDLMHYQEQLNLMDGKPIL
jgi:hypothetical protein